MSLIPRTERAAFSIKPLSYGKSVLGAPLLYFPAQIESESRGLILAGTHGDETASIAGLSCALRSLPAANLRHDVILSMNPDGNQLGTRANANQVDLNRAFPTQNWTENGTVYRWSSHTPVRDVKVKTGQANQLEPEVQSLINLIEQRQPKFVISFHEPLAMVDDPTQSELAILARQTVQPTTRRRRRLRNPRLIRHMVPRKKPTVYYRRITTRFCGFDYRTVFGCVCGGVGV